MLIEKITSRQNPLVKRFRTVRMGSERHLIFLEGVRLVRDALGSGVHIESVVFTGALGETGAGSELLELLEGVSCRGAQITEQVMLAIADTENPQGVAALASRPVHRFEDLAIGTSSMIVVADRLQDPGNIGSIIRTAEAAGADAVVTTIRTVDPFNQKALRASMGSALRIPVVTGIRKAELSKRLREQQLKIIAARPRPLEPESVIVPVPARQRTLLYTEVDMTGPVAIVLGSEALGLRETIAREADIFAYIPMAEGIDSLNVAAAAAILLFEAARQRGFAFSSRDAGSDV